MIDKQLLREARKQRVLFALTVASGFLSAGAVLLQTWYTAVIVNGLFLAHSALTELGGAFAIALAALVVRVLLDCAEEAASLKLATAIKGDLRRQIIDKLGTLSLVQLEQMQKGKLLNLLYDGVDTLEKYFSSYLPQLYKAVAIPVLFLVVVFPKDRISALIMLITLPLIPVFMVLIGKWTKRESVRQWLVLTRFAAFLQDVLQGLVALKTIGRSKKLGEKIGEISEAYRKATFQVQKWAFISSLALELVATISIAMIAVGLGLRLCDGSLSFLIGFFILLLAPEYYQPLRTLGQYFHAGINAQEASNSIYEFLDTTTWQAKEGAYSEAPVRTIRFERVCYRYPGASEDALRNISLELHEGEAIAFIGASGSGKTTLMMLAMGFLAPSAGQIFVNDVPLQEWQREAYHARIGAVLQTPYIFAGTVLENIAFRAPLSEDEAERASAFAARVGLSHLLRTVPTGLQTPIGQGGQSLSGGQRALLMVARALYAKGDVLFFDEMTDNLDLESERALVESLDTLLEGRSTWVIAHRLQTLGKMDRIYYMDKGAICAEGDYQTMMQLVGKLQSKGGGQDA